MKIYFALLLCLLISNLYTRKLHKRSFSYSRNSIVPKNPGNGKLLYHFAMGAYGELIGYTYLDLNSSSKAKQLASPFVKCLPKEWLGLEDTKMPKDKQEIQGVFNTYTDRLFEDFINFKYSFSFLFWDYDFDMGDILNKVCSVKSDLIAGLSTVNVNRRFFLQSSSTMKRRTAIKIENAITKVLKTHGLISWLIGKIGELFKPLLIKLRKFFVNFFSSKEFIQKMLKVLYCTLNIKNTIVPEASKAKLRNFINATNRAISGGWGGMVYALVNGFCEWNEFKKTLKSYLLVSSNPAHKYRILGRFYGNLIKTIGSGVGK